MIPFLKGDAPRRGNAQGQIGKTEFKIDCAGAKEKSSPHHSTRM
jgi:hypothetical protein